MSCVFVVIITQGYMMPLACMYVINFEHISLIPSFLSLLLPLPMSPLCAQFHFSFQGICAILWIM